MQTALEFPVGWVLKPGFWGKELSVGHHDALAELERDSGKSWIKAETVGSVD